MVMPMYLEAASLMIATVIGIYTFSHILKKRRQRKASMRLNQALEQRNDQADAIARARQVSSAAEVETAPWGGPGERVESRGRGRDRRSSGRATSSTSQDNLALDTMMLNAATMPSRPRSSSTYDSYSSSDYGSSSSSDSGSSSSSCD